MKSRRHSDLSRRQSPSGRRSRWLLASGVALGGVVAPHCATAQQADTSAQRPEDATAPGAAASAPTGPAGTALGNSQVSNLQSVVVTARKKREKLSEVPLSITAVTAQTLQDAGSRNLQDVANLTTGLTISAAGAEAQLVPTIRGLTNLNGGSGDPNVAVFLDGIYLANNSAISLGLVAVERVEVVKGPVSALYGRNAFAGAINYISKKPPDTFGGEVEVGVANAGGRTAKATIGGAIVPQMFNWLVSVGYDKSDGTWKDSNSGARAGGYKKQDGLFSFTMNPTKQLSIEGTYYYGDDRFDDVPLGNAVNNCGSKTGPATGAGADPVNPNAFKQFCGSFNYQPVQVPTINPAAGVTGNQRRAQSDRLRVGYDFDGFDASLLYGNNDVKQRRYNDFTGSNIGIPYLLTNGSILYSNEQFGNVLNNSDDQLELRFSSHLNQPVRWSFGYNYYKANSDAQTLVGIDGSQLPPGTSFAPVIGLPVQSLWVTSNGSYGPGLGRATQVDTVHSPFASAEWDIVPALTASGEVRHTKEDKSQTVFSTTSNLNPVNVAGNGTNTGFKSYGFNNYRTALRYKLSDDAMVYASIANGTKAGGFNSRATIAADLSFDPERNKSYEAGTKLSFLEHRLEVGFAAFHIDTQGIQISGPAADPTNPGLVTKNFGGTRSNGFELDLAAVPVKGLKLNAGLGFADSKFKSDAIDFTVAKADCDNIPVCASREVTVAAPSGNKFGVALGGLRVPRSSRYTGTLGAQYNGVLTDRWGYLARVDYRYESSREIQNANYATIPSRNLLNMRVALEDDKYRLTFFVNNVTNNTTPEGVAQNTRLNDFTGPYAGALPAKRTFGVIGNVIF